jgi:flagellar hook-associated protein 2
VAGTYTLEVTQLAQAHQIVSTTSAFTKDAGGTTRLTTGGTLTIALGTASDADATKSTTIEIDDGASIETIRDKINAASAGVSAVIVNGSAGKQLVLTGDTSGDDQVITLSGIDSLSYDGSGTGVDEFTQAQAAQGSKLTLNGIEIEANTNTVTTAVDGLTLNLLKESEAGVATKITVSRNTSSLTSAVNTFVTAFNNFNSTSSSLGSYNATTETAGTLNGDSTLRSTQNKIRSLLTSIPSELSGATYQLLSNIGVSLQKDGSLAVDSTKLSSAISNDFTGVSNLLSAVGTAFDDAIDGLTGSDGIIAARTDGLNATIKRYEKQYEVISARLEKIEERYRTQFTALETLISSMNSTSAYLTQQLANLPSYNNSN